MTISRYRLIKTALLAVSLSLSTIACSENDKGNIMSLLHTAFIEVIPII